MEIKKRPLSSITHDECLEIGALLLGHPMQTMLDPKKKWEVISYKDHFGEDEMKGLLVRSDKNIYRVEIDFDLDDITVNNEDNNWEEEPINVKTSFELVNLLNSKGIYFDWQK